MRKVGRQAWCAALFVVGCAPGSAAADPPSLSVIERGSGATVVVLMHGYGAPGDDLVPLGDSLAARAPGTRFVMPAAPRRWRHGGAGRAWYEHMSDDADAQRAVARRQLDALITSLDAERLVLAGFSQGGVMAIDLALTGRRVPDALVVLSGRALPDHTRGWSRLRGRLALVSHGRADPIIPFASGERIARQAERGGARTTFVPFDGAHQIPPAAIDAFAELLRAPR